MMARARMRIGAGIVLAGIASIASPIAAGTKAARASEAYLPRCFIYRDGRPARLPTTPWARSALYTPGQVWCPEGVNRDDVNPRPLSSIIPSNGLIGCVSADGQEMLATA